MPNIKSAKKRMKTDALKKVHNKKNISTMRTAIKKTKKDLSVANVNDAVKKIDKALAKGLIKKNKAARDKSKLMKSVNEVK